MEMLMIERLYWREKPGRCLLVAVYVAALAVSSFVFWGVGFAQTDTATETAPRTGSRTTRLAAQDSRNKDFPPELVNWKAWPGNPIFTAEGPGHWDVKIRERGWILHNNAWKLWFTGYDGTRAGIKMLGYATSIDGVHWTRSPKNPVYREHWVEDMSVVHNGDTYFMFAESENDNHAEMLTSKNGTDWKWIGKLDVRQTDENKIARRPCGTPTVWVEGNNWYLMYEWMDKGVWLATSKDPMSLVWRDVQEEPALSPGPDSYDKELIAVNQVIKYKGVYYAIYHGSGSGAAVPRTWTTDIARSTDRVHWQKYSGNPLVKGNKSSGMVVPAGEGFRLYTMHDQVDLYESK
jgi:hypothetical protein